MLGGRVGLLTVDDALGAGIQFCGDDDHLVGAVQLNISQWDIEFVLEGGIQAAGFQSIPLEEKLIDVHLLWFEGDYSRGLINGLCDNIP